MQNKQFRRLLDFWLPAGISNRLGEFGRHCLNVTRGRERWEVATGPEGAAPRLLQTSTNGLHTSVYNHHFLARLGLAPKAFGRPAPAATGSSYPSVRGSGGAPTIL
jgi:hypothetical protein